MRIRIRIHFFSSFFAYILWVLSLRWVSLRLPAARRAIILCILSAAEHWTLNSEWERKRNEQLGQKKRLSEKFHAFERYARTLGCWRFRGISRRLNFANERLREWVRARGGDSVTENVYNKFRNTWAHTHVLRVAVVARMLTAVQN